MLCHARGTTVRAARARTRAMTPARVLVIALALGCGGTQMPDATPSMAPPASAGHDLVYRTLTQTLVADIDGNLQTFPA